jgi:hypothetical protein
MSAKYRFVLATLIKNEAWDICEWIAFHVLQGVDHFYLYNNDSTDDLAFQLSRIPATLVTVIDIPGAGVQLEAYNHFLVNFGQSSVFSAMIDADEYICGLDKVRIEDLITPDVSGIALNWLNFGSSGHIKRPKSLVIDAFSHRPATDFALNKVIKCLYRTSDIVGAFMHKNSTKKAIVDLWGRPLVTSSLPGELADENAIVTLRHYSIKSFSHFCKKATRQDGVFPLKYVKLAYFRGRDINDIHAPIAPVYIESVSRMLQTFKPDEPASDQIKFDAVAELLHGGDLSEFDEFGLQFAGDAAYGFAQLARSIGKLPVAKFFLSQVNPERAAFLDKAEASWSVALGTTPFSEVLPQKTIICDFYRGEKNAARVLTRLLEALDDAGRQDEIIDILNIHQPESFESAPTLAQLGELAWKYNEAELSLKCLRRATELSPGVQIYLERYIVLCSRSENHGPDCFDAIRLFKAQFTPTKAVFDAEARCKKRESKQGPRK